MKNYVKTHTKQYSTLLKSCKNITNTSCTFLTAIKLTVVMHQIIKHLPIERQTVMSFSIIYLIFVFNIIIVSQKQKKFKYEFIIYY